MLPLLRRCPDIVPVCHWVREKKGRVAIKSMIDTVWRTKKNLIICHHLSPVFQDVHLSKEASPTHRLSPAFGIVGRAPVPSIFLQIITSNNSIIHLKPKLQISNQIGPMEVGCALWSIWISGRCITDLSSSSRPYQFCLNLCSQLMSFWLRFPDS